MNNQREFIEKLSYDDVLRIKEECYQVIEKYYGKNYLAVFRYFKGDLGCFVNKNIRRNMTTGDIDFIQWDYSISKKILRIIECKKINEYQKESQDKLLDFLSKLFIILNKICSRIPFINGYTFKVYKIIADPPYNIVDIIDYTDKKAKTRLNQKGFIKFLSME